MRIAVDALGLPRFGGAKASATGWLAALARHGPENQYLVFLSRPEESLSPFANVRQRIVPVSNRFLVRIWAQLVIPQVLAHEQIDLLHNVKNLGVFGAPCPTIVTVNDLSHVVLQRLYPRADGFYWERIQPRLLRRAARVIAISENTRQDLLRLYRLEAERVVTIHPACDERYYQPCAAVELRRVHSRYGLPQKMLLYVGGLGVHKNVITLVRAFGRIANAVPHGLVVVGGAHHTTSDHDLSREAAAMGLSDRVWNLGSVPEEDLRPLYHQADLFLLASLNEGFGLVLVEAMACGLPVVAAGTSSVQEVVGDAARLIDDPTDGAAFAGAMLELLANRETLSEMRQRGLDRSRLFSWERTAVKTLALYHDIVDGRRPFPAVVPCLR